ncbi:MAG: recombination regulator RecX [Gammaproteobacteria bacterium]|nr:recombination regulator RecX [Gammaproteobacteria bacterium]GIS86712.1 MAG: regulatory protein RecX [Woeseia sp.]
MSESPSENKIIRKKAMDYLSRREHSRYELYKKISTHNFDKDLINQELDLLIRDGLLSDERFVEAFIHSRKKNGKGPLKISAELQQRGADESLINKYIEEIENSEWLDSAKQVVEKKLGNNQQLDYDNQLKMMKFLNNRGFTIDQVKLTIKKLKKDEEVG